MADTPWTPGPWGPDTNVVLRGSHGAQFGFLNCDPGTPRDLEARANMSLVTAAPDMAEALAECVDWLETEFEGHGDEERPEKHMLARARAALAKARGNQ